MQLKQKEQLVDEAGLAQIRWASQAVCKDLVLNAD